MNRCFLFRDNGNSVRILLLRRRKDAGSGTDSSTKLRELTFPVAGVADSMAMKWSSVSSEKTIPIGKPLGLS